MPHKRSFLTLAMVLACSGTAAGQVTAAFNIRYQHAPRPYVVPMEVLARPNGGAIIVGLGYESSGRSGPADVIVAAFDEHGENTWSWHAPAARGALPSFFDRATAYADIDGQGNTIVAYTGTPDSHIVSLTPSGAVRWRDTTSRPVPVGVDVNAAGDIRVASFGWGSATWPSMAIDAFDSGGTGRWTWIGDYAQGTPGIAHGVHLSPNGKTYVYGQNDWPFFAPYQKSIALQVDASGQLDWYDDHVTNAGTLQNRVGDLTPSGDLVTMYTGFISNWPGSDPAATVRRYGQGGINQIGTSLNAYLPAGSPRDLKVGTNDHVYVAFSALDRIIRIDASGALLPDWTLPLPSVEVLALMPTDDGGLLATGLRDVGPSTGTFTVRFDASGAVVWLHDQSGSRPPGLDDYYPTSTDFDIALDSRGNVLLSNSTGGVGFVERRTGITKLIGGPPVGSNYCGPAPANSGGIPGNIEARGSDARSDDNISLFATGLPTNAYVLFLASPQTGFVVAPGGSQGNLCLAGAIGRYVGANQIRRARSDGRAYLQIDLDVIPRPATFQSALAGETWNFQAMYRDFVGGVPTSNFTDGVAVTLQ